MSKSSKCVHQWTPITIGIEYLTWDTQFLFLAVILSHLPVKHNAPIQLQPAKPFPRTLR